jgi:hypothetical protein
MGIFGGKMLQMFQNVTLQVAQTLFAIYWAQAPHGDFKVRHVILGDLLDDSEDPLSS